MSRRVLITGGFGYLGSQIATKLANNVEYIVRMGSRRARLAPAWLVDAETTMMDITVPESLDDALRDVQVVIHLASMSQNQCNQDPDSAIRVNEIGTQHVLTAAIGAGVQRFIYFSTAHIYGLPFIGNITEQTLPKGNSLYATTHYSAEKFVFAAHRKNQIDGIVVRLSNGFGVSRNDTSTNWDLLVNDLCRQVVRTGKMVLKSSGTQQRDFITLDDIACGVMHLLELPRHQCGDGLFNLGGELTLSIMDMALRIAERAQKLFGYTPEIICLIPRRNEIDSDAALIYSCSKLQCSGFQLKKQVNVAIDETLNLCAKLYKRKTNEAPTNFYCYSNI